VAKRGNANTGSTIGSDHVSKEPSPVKIQHGGFSWNAESPVSDVAIPEPQQPAGKVALTLSNSANKRDRAHLIGSSRQYFGMEQILNRKAIIFWIFCGRELFSVAFKLL